MKRGARGMGRASGILMAVLLLVGAQELVAQRGGGASRRDMELRFQTRTDNMVQEELQLGDDQWQQLQGAMQAFRVRRLDFSQSERNTRARVGRLGGPGGGRDLSEEEASEILAEMLELAGAEATLVREEQEAYLRILSASQVVRLMMVRQRIGDMSRAVRGRGGLGRGRGSQRGRGRGGPGR